jgi:beta-galactosidase/beta-glucuronidase
MKQTIIALILCGVALDAAMGAVKEVEKGAIYNDVFANIATQEYEKRDTFPMEHVPPPELPDGPVFAYTGSSAFEPMDKMDTDDEVYAGLAALRKQYKPFLQDLAPEMEEARKRLYVPDMQFRLETDQDRADFSHTLAGKGEWEQVDIPYYHGPNGRATAWYRREIELTDAMLGTDILMLHFKGADYLCDAYFNGHHVGYHEGMLDAFEFDVKPYARKGKNTILVRLRNDYSMHGSMGGGSAHKLAACNSPGWDDPMTGWNNCPRGFGLYQDLYLETRSYASIVDIFPRPMLQDKCIELWIETELPQAKRQGEFILQASVFGQNFEAEIVSNQRKEIKIKGGRCLYKMKLDIPEEKLRLWDPETPWLYQVQVQLLNKDGTQVLDAMKRQFGMRSFVISEQSEPKGRLYLNGKEVRLRGCNTMGYLQRDVMTKDWEQLIDDMLLHKLSNMNFIRTTQRSVQEEVYDYADRLGVMMQSDLPLFSQINHKQWGEAINQAGRMERLLRSHPSVIMISYLNESMAGMRENAISRAEYEHMFEAADLFVHHENPDRAVKYVDGDYQSPNKGLPDEHCYNIWYHGHGLKLGDLHKGGWRHTKKDWMYGCGEFGAEGLDTVDLMMRRYPDQWMPEGREQDGDWTPERIRTAYKRNQTWDKHWDWFETQDNMADWVKMSHEHQVWGLRMVTESFRRMPRMNTFAVHLFIDAWPNGWLKTLVDCERKPKPAWFAYRDALTPVSVQLRTDRTAFFAGETLHLETWICNDTHAAPDAELRYQVEKDGAVISSGTVDATLPTISEGSRFQGYLPVTAPATDKRTSMTVRLGLFDKTSGARMHESDLRLDLYPAPANNGKGERLYLIGSNNGDVKSITAAFNAELATEGKIRDTDTILVTGYKKYLKHQPAIDQAVKAGATCVILPVFKDKNLEEMTIGQSRIKFSDKALSRWILFRNTEHPWMAGTGHNDFKFWYSDLADVAVEHHFRRFTADGFNPVLTVRTRPVVAERTDGKGRWVICQTELTGRAVNPACRELLEKLLFQQN